MVVGAGIPSYFSNCLRSISQHSTHDVLAFYNWVDDDDYREVYEIAKQYESTSVRISLQRNVLGRRTGSLYDAYNQGIELALGKYRYASFIQADMQMMWWSDRILSTCDSIINSCQGANSEKFCFFTQIPVQGKREDYYAEWRDNDGGFKRIRKGAVDVGIFTVNSIFNQGLRFEGTENEFSEGCVKHGVNLILHPYPFLAPIPFPLTVRERQLQRQKRNPRTNNPEMVRSPLAREVINFEKDSFHPLFMEDLVWPNGWKTLTPYWPSDTLGPEWFRIRFRKSRAEGFPLTKTQSGKRTSAMPLGRFRPGFLRLFSSGLQLVLRELKTRFSSP